VLTHPMLDQLSQLGLSGMAQAFAELEASDETAELTHADWLGLLVDRELTHRRDKRLAARLRYARLRQQASVEDVDYRAPRGLDRALFHKLTNGEWIDAHDNLILCGPTGVGKSWLACALGHKACRDNRSVLYQRVPKLFAELALARGDGRYARILRGLTGVQLLILDDWGLEPLDAGARRDLYEILVVIRWEAAGIGPNIIGALWSMSVAAEVVVFLFIGRPLLDRIGPAHAAMIAAAAGALRWVIMAETTWLPALAAIQPLHGLTFALLHLTCMRLLAQCAPRHLEATALTVYGTVGIGLPTALLIIGSGQLYSHFGAKGFFVMAALCAVAVPFARTLREPS
jgi:DNA replication protein DnaC